MILSDKKAIKRLAIFFFYDKDGIVDDYIPYMLNDLNKNISELLIVCNGKLTPEGRKKFKTLTPNVLVRENKGFDVWAYKEGMELYGWENLKKFDELILMNFTIFGPLYPFKEMFDEMDKRDVDFWGITKFHRVQSDPFGIEYGYIPEHIQSHFLVVRNELLSSHEYYLYWKNMPEINSYEDAVGKHEAIFTKKFFDKGFAWDTYVDNVNLENHSHCPILFAPLNLIIDKRCPIIKRRSFFHQRTDFLSFGGTNQATECLEYINKNLDYDINLIWDNILRSCNQRDIYEALQLNYVIPSKVSYLTQNITSQKIALIIHIYYEDLIDYCFKYACSVNEDTDVYITTDTYEKKLLIEKTFSKLRCAHFKVTIIENQGRDVSALLVGCKDFIMDYDLVCFLHDKKVTQLDYSIKGEAFANKCFENIIGSQSLFNNIIYLFNNNPRLGMLCPTPPNHADYYPTLSDDNWKNTNYNNTKNLANKLQLMVDIDINKEPIAPLGTMFWFRPSALKPLFDFDWDYNDFPKEPNNNDGTILHAIERIYPLVTQQSGYYPAYVTSDSCASNELTNLYYMMIQLNSRFFTKTGRCMFWWQLNTLTSNSDTIVCDTEYLKLVRMAKLKHKLKNWLPGPLFKLVVNVKRLILGPRGLKGNY